MLPALLSFHCHNHNYTALHYICLSFCQKLQPCNCQTPELPLVCVNYTVCLVIRGVYSIAGSV